MADYTKAPLGEEDIYWYDGTTSTFTRTASTGETLTLTKVGAWGGSLKSMMPFINVKDYGAEGDGSTDDTTAIQNAIDSLTSGGMVYFPEGTYKITDGLTVPVSNIKLKGEYWQKSIIKGVYTGNTPMILYDQVHYCSIEDVGLLGDNTDTPNYGIRLDYHVGFVINNLYINRILISPLDFLTTWEATGNNIRIVNCGDGGTSTTGVWNFGSSGSVPGNCTQSNFNNIIMGSNYGCHLLCGTVVGGMSAVHFNNFIAETNKANDVGTDDNSFMKIRSCNGVKLNNFNITVNSKDDSTGAGYVFDSSTSYSQNIVFSNGTVRINLDANAPVHGIINHDSNYGDLNFANVMFEDPYDKIAAQHFAVCTYGGFGVMNFKNCLFNSALLPSELSDTYLSYRGDFSIERLGVISRQEFNAYLDFADQDATPSVKRKDFFRTSNTVNTTITMFDDGYLGQIIRVIINDAKTTIQFRDAGHPAAHLLGNAGVDWTPTTGDWLEAIFDGTDWYCSVHDCTA